MQKWVWKYLYYLFVFWSRSLASRCQWKKIKPPYLKSVSREYIHTQSWRTDWKQPKGSERRCAKEGNSSDEAKLPQAPRHEPPEWFLLVLWWLIPTGRCAPCSVHVWNVYPLSPERDPLVKKPEHKILFSAMILTGVDNKYGITDGCEWCNWQYLRPEERGIVVNSLNQ